MPTHRRQTDASFEVTPPPGYATAFLVLSVGVLPVLIVAGMMLTGRMNGAGLVRFLPVLGIVFLLLCFLLLAMKRRSVALAGGVLDVRAALYRERTPAAAMDLARARIVDLADHTELRPFIKTNGMSVPGFNAGHFRLRGKLNKAFCLITDRHRVLWLPLGNGKDHLLLSLERPQALLDALQAAVGDPARRE